MIYLYRCFLVFFLLCARTGYAQVNITKLWKEADPLQANLSISPEEKLIQHADYLKNAVAKNDITGQFYGNLYLYTDNMDEQNYAAAIPFLLKAENIAENSGNINWQGFIKLRSGWVAFIVHNDPKTAIKEFKAGAQLSASANDSLCQAKCFEQISTMYNGLKEFDSSQHYFDLAIPVLRKSADIKLDAVYSNYSGLWLNQGQPEKALLYIDSSIQIIQVQKNKRKENFYLINRAVILNGLKRHDSAEAIFKKCMAIDAANKWMDNLLYDYEGLNDTYHAKGNYTAAYDYLKKYHSLKDSLAGVAVNLKVAGITAAHKTELARSSASYTLQKRNWIVGIISFLLFIALLFWRLQYNRNKREQLKSKKDLAELTRILIEKNTQLAGLEEQLITKANNSLTEKISSPVNIVNENKQLTEEQPYFENDLYNQRILTAEDWASFKIYFDKAYPGYLFRLRNTYTTLTEAEERMFLFIKLKLTNKESAAILGISADSVKKTKNRLRKRIELDESTDLDVFIKEF